MLQSHMQHHAASCSQEAHSQSLKVSESKKSMRSKKIWNWQHFAVVVSVLGGVVSPNFRNFNLVRSFTMSAWPCSRGNRCDEFWSKRFRWEIARTFRKRLGQSLLKLCRLVVGCSTDERNELWGTEDQMKELGACALCSTCDSLPMCQWWTTFPCLFDRQRPTQSRSSLLQNEWGLHTSRFICTVVLCHTDLQHAIVQYVDVCCGISAVFICFKLCFPAFLRLFTWSFFAMIIAMNRARFPSSS